MYKICYFLLNLTIELKPSLTQLRYCCCCFVVVVVVIIFVVVVDDDIVVVVDPRNLPLKIGQNWVRNR